MFQNPKSESYCENKAGAKRSSLKEADYVFFFCSEQVPRLLHYDDAM